MVILVGNNECRAGKTRKVVVRPMLEVLENRLAPAVFLVDRLTDDPKDGDLAAMAGSLRWCLGQANSESFTGPDTIRFQVQGTLGLTQGSLGIYSDVQIVNPFSPGSVRIRLSDPMAVSSIFNISGSTTVGMKGLTLSDGNAFQGEGGAGGAIFSNASSLTLTDCTLQNNSASSGGAIYSTGGLALVRCLLENNQATFSGGAISQYGGSVSIVDSYFRLNSAGKTSKGGALSLSDTSATITRTTFAGNTAFQGAAIEASASNQNTTLLVYNSTLSGNQTTDGGSGGAIWLQMGFSEATLLARVFSSTIANNQATTTGGIALDCLGGTLQLEVQNTILAGNDDASIAVNPHEGGNPVVTSLGHNLSSDDTGYLDQVTDLTSTNPLLSPLLLFGGLTPTHMLLPGSPAINAGIAIAGLPTDQRGVARTQGSAPDIGAVETRTFTFSSTGSGQSTPVTTRFASNLTFRILEGGVPLAGIPIRFSVNGEPPPADFGDSASSILQTTASNGVATASALFAGTLVGPVTVTARVGNLDFNYALQIVAGPVAEFVVFAPGSLFNTQPYTLLVRPLDAYGNLVTSGIGEVVFSSSDARATFPARFNFDRAGLTFDANNRAFVIPGFAFDSVGQQTIRITQAGQPAVTGSTTSEVTNPQPTNLVIAVSSTAVREGESFTLSGVFSDASPREVHTVAIDWGDGQRETITLAGGATTFSLPHRYTSGLPIVDPADLAIRVTVSDALASIAAETPITVYNEAPLLSVGGDEFVNVGEVYTRTGKVRDAGLAGGMTGTIDYGDGSGIKPLNIQPDGTFTMTHSYAHEGSFLVQVRVDDGRGGTDSAVYFMDVLLKGIPTNFAHKVTVEPGSASTVRTLGAAATLYRDSGDTGYSAIIVSPVPVPVAAFLNRGNYFVGMNQIIVASYDVRTINVSERDYAIIQFTYFYPSSEMPTLKYYNPRTGQLVSVYSLVYQVDTDRKEIVFRLDRFANPGITNLNGTVFTISVPTLTPPTPQGQDSATVFTATLVTYPVDQQPEYSNSSEGLASLTTTSSQDSLLIGSSSRTSSDSRARNSGGRSQEEEEEEGRTRNALAQLPKVPQRVVTVPGLTLTPGNAEPAVPAEPAVNVEEDRKKDKEPGAEESSEPWSEEAGESGNGQQTEKEIAIWTAEEKPFLFSELYDEVQAQEFSGEDPSLAVLCAAVALFGGEGRWRRRSSALEVD